MIGHPKISAISNELFYGGSLSNGISPEQRIPIIDSLPTLCFIGVEGEERFDKNSYTNEAEIGFIKSLVGILLEKGVPGIDIGCVCLYKGQVAAIELAIGLGSGKKCPIQISTVDGMSNCLCSVTRPDLFPKSFPRRREEHNPVVYSPLEEPGIH